MPGIYIYIYTSGTARLLPRGPYFPTYASGQIDPRPRDVCRPVYNVILGVVVAAAGIGGERASEILRSIGVPAGTL